jgi:PKD domain-containing protein
MPSPLKHLRIVPVVAMLVFAPSALAKEYCVAPAAGCADGTSQTVQDALDLAAANAGPDTVRLGAATYTSSGGFAYVGGASAANTVALVGAGRDATTLTRSTNGSILQLGGTPRESVTDLRFHITGTTNSSGILGGSGDALRVDVDADASVVNSEGLQLNPGSARDVHIAMPASGGNFGFAGGGPAATDGVFDSTITADKAVTLYSGSIRHSTLTGGNRAIDIQSGTIDDVVARATGTAPSYGVFASTGMFGGTNSAVARHLTVVGEDEPGSVGIGVYATTTVMGSATQSLDVRSTIVRGFGKSFVRSGQAGAQPGTANLAIHFTDYSPSSATQSGPGTTPDPQEASNIDADPLFADGLRLRAASPLVDAGDPAAPAVNEPATDLAGENRVVGGVSDMGAFEYQRRAPVLSGVTASPTTAVVGVPIAFSATATDPDGEDAALTWQFDDGAASDGADAQHAFAQPGGHLATVTATDPAGVTATAQVSVSISPPDVIVPPKPALSALKLSPSKFRAKSGTSVSFKLNTPARVTFRVVRCRSAKKCRPVKGSFKRSGSAGADRFHFRGRLRGKLLRPAKYRLVATAGRSTRRAKFTVKRPARG